jgi:hypothetical protein
MIAAMETFVVRIFVPNPDGQAVPLCGIVEHVSSGRAEAFQGIHDLASLVACALEWTAAKRTAPRDEGGRQSAERLNVGPGTDRDGNEQGGWR